MNREALHRDMDKLFGVHRPEVHFALDAVMDADTFKEPDHPRKKDGKFAPKGGGEVSMPKGMEHLTKGNHKTVASYCYAALADGNGKWSNGQIAQAAQAQFGGHTSAASVAWYKMKAKAATPAGAKAAAAHQAAVKSVSDQVAAAASSPAPQAKVDASIDAAAKASAKTSFIKVLDGVNFKYIKLSNIPDGLQSDYGAVNDALKLSGISGSVVSVSPFDASKTAPANLQDVALPNGVASKLEEKAYEKNKQQELVTKAVTEFETDLAAHLVKSIKSYTDGSFKTLNACLRNGAPMNDSTATLAANIDAALAKAKATTDFTVTRGLDDITKFCGPNPTVGTVLMDNGYVSTSKNPNWNWGSGMKARISVKKGQRAMDIKSMSLHGSESEVLLPRGSLFKITGVSDEFLELEYMG